MRRWFVLAGLTVVLAGVLASELGAVDSVAEVTAPPSVLKATVAPAPDAALLSGVAVTLQGRPLFSPSRRPPAAAPVTAEAAADGLPRLAGVIVGPSGRHAIFVDSTGHPRVGTEGSSIGGFTVRAIAPGEVTVSSSAGERVLRPSYSNIRQPETIAAAIPQPVAPPHSHAQ